MRASCELCVCSLFALRVLGVCLCCACCVCVCFDAPSFDFDMSLCFFVGGLPLPGYSKVTPKPPIATKRGLRTLVCFPCDFVGLFFYNSQVTRLVMLQKSVRVAGAWNPSANLRWNSYGLSSRWPIDFVRRSQCFPAVMSHGLLKFFFGVAEAVLKDQKFIYSGCPTALL